MSAVGRLVKKFRLKKRLTQKSLAEKVGVTSAFISKIERGSSGMPWTTGSKIVDLLEIPYKSLVSARRNDWIDLIEEKESDSRQFRFDKSNLQG